MEGQVIIADGEEFAIINLIAKGKGGYNYLARTRDTFVVVKQIHYEPCDYYQFEDNKLNSELRDYKTLYDLGIPMPKLLFSCQERQLLIKEYINGETLAKIAANDRIKTSYITQIFEMCERLYPNHLNIDYFPTNFMEQNGKIYYVDYECSQYTEEWNFENWGIYFLANQNGMKNFVECEDYSLLLENGKPIRNVFEDTVKQWLMLR
ncbi:MAG: hypothetical protein FWH17_07900 [Oscillospiraceae bacterium]|nr:hypothetical protein [Oscillospiraceae bacterium]